MISGFLIEFKNYDLKGSFYHDSRILYTKTFKPANIVNGVEKLQIWK
jgi:hypothetical protein